MPEYRLPFKAVRGLINPCSEYTQILYITLLRSCPNESPALRSLFKTFKERSGSVTQRQVGCLTQARREVHVACGVVKPLSTPFAYHMRQ
jgi:hypothetical protein